MSATTRSHLDAPVSVLPGVGEESAKVLAKMDIVNVSDLLWHLPRDYADFSKFTPLARVRADAMQTVEAILGKIGQRRTARGQQMTEVELIDPADHTPSKVRATWFGRQFIKERFPEGQLVRLSGRVKWFGKLLQFSNPKIEPASAEPVHTGRIVPIYKLTEGVKEGSLRRWLHSAVVGTERRGPYVDALDDPLPQSLREQRELLGIRDAIREIHFPSDWSSLFNARRRLAFDELLVLQLALGQRRARWRDQAKALPLRVDDAVLDGWIRALPFALTGGQQRALAEIRADLEKRVPMSRLLEGDVGSGKTVVAALGARIAVASGAQAALMAPTELLAEQHHRSLATLFANGGPRLALLTSSVSGKERTVILAELARGDIDVVVGTHALVEETVVFARLAFAVVDEQHRFGVRQRATFREKGLDPHLLLTTATPIPQTLSQTVYRDLDISTLTELPAGRQRIGTAIRTTDQLDRVWQGVRERVAAGEQVFVVCPRIHSNDADDDDEVASAERTYEELRTGALKGLRLELLHGRMPAKDRDRVMRAFADGAVDVLIATTVVEVGIDIPNATAMIVLGAEHFGLAQLHQLRGRVGRGTKRSYCVLVSDDEASERLGAMIAKNADGEPLNGFDLAKRDLEIRGAGEFLGERQHGVPELRIVDLSDVDPRLVSETAAEADRILAADADLEAAEHRALAHAVDLLWRRYALA